MNTGSKNKLNKLKMTVILSLVFVWTSPHVYSGAFTPPTESIEPETLNQEIIPPVLREYEPIEIKSDSAEETSPTEKAEETTSAPEQIATNTIYLDTSQVNQALLKGLLPSPSEYEKNNNSQQNQQYNPIRNTQTELKRVEKTSDSNETEVKKDEPSFQIFDSFAPPSKYIKPIKPEETETLPPAETITEEVPASYYASAHTDDNADCEGKIIKGITINGLKLINKKDVLSVISSTNGTEFHAYQLQKDLQAIYNMGYFSDRMEIEPTYNEKDDTVSLCFNLKENPEIKEIVITGNSVIPTKELTKYTKHLKHTPQNLILINNSIEEIHQYYEEKGYILGKVANIDDDNNGTLTFEITEGVIEKIEFEGEHKTKDYVMQRNMMTSAGSVYNEEVLKKDISRLYATQIFEEVDRKIEPSPDKDGEYVLKIVVKEASSNSISIGGGVDNALGLFGSLSILEKNFMGKGQQIGATGMVGSGLLLNDASIKNHMNYQAEIFFKEPHFINSDNSLISKAYLRELGSYQIPLAIERRFGFNATISHKVKGNDKLSTNLGIGYENIHLKEGDANRIYQLYAERNIDFSNRKKQLSGGNFINFAPSIQYSDLDDEFMPRSGIVANASFMESLCVDNMKKTNGRIMGSLKKYIPIFKKSSLIITARGGAKVHGKNMPEVMSFALGGPYNIRGFRMSGVGTGDAFLMGSAELQTPIPFMDRFKYDVLKNLRFAFFIDAGKIFDPTISSKLYDRPNSAIVGGVGLRINIPNIGPISIDYGLPFTHVGQYNSKRGYFTFGTGGLYDGY